MKIKNKPSLQKYTGIAEKALFISLSGLGFSFFCSSWGINRFSMWSLYILLIWRFIIGYEPVRSLPKSLLLFSGLYLASFFISAFLATDKTFIISALKDHRVFFLAGLLFTAPLNNKLRIYVLILFFVSAIFGGLVGIYQYFGLFPNTSVNYRAHGLAENSIIYATQLAFACGISILAFIFKGDGLLKSRKELSLVLVTILITLSGILFSETRGIWLALFAACSISLFSYNRRKAAYFLLFSSTLLILIFSVSSPLKNRAISITTSVINPDSDPLSTAIRLKLWKAALLIFKDSPLFGTGVGDFKNDVDSLIQNNKIDPILDPARGNAHSSFFHTLATQGLVGFVLLFGLYTSLILFAAREIRLDGSFGGYSSLLITVILIVGGLTVPYLGGIGMGMILKEYCFIFGLVGPMNSQPKLP